MIMLKYRYVQMKQKLKEKLEAMALRKRGYSLYEIIKGLGVSKSSASVWVRNVPLSSRAQKRLLTRISKGQLAGAESKRRKTQATLDFYFNKAKKDIRSGKISALDKRIVCSLLYFCEGIKNHFGGMKFSNSSPELIALFLKLFRTGFKVKEKKV